MGKGLGELTAEDISLYREHLIGTYAGDGGQEACGAEAVFDLHVHGGRYDGQPESLRFFAKSPRVRQDPAYNVLTEDELSRMLSAARASNYRDYVMLAVMAGCGSGRPRSWTQDRGLPRSGGGSGPAPRPRQG